MDFDPTKISFKELLHLFWNNHEYGLTTKIKRQVRVKKGFVRFDTKRMSSLQYASIIFYRTEDQKRIAEESRVEEQERRKNEKIITEVNPFAQFYPAEE